VNKIALGLIVAVAATLCGGATLAQGRGAPPGGGHSGGHVAGHPGTWHGAGPGHRDGGWRGNWHGGWWGPRVGVYFGAPLYFGAWSYPWYDPFPYPYYAYPYRYAPYGYYVPPDSAYVEPPPAQEPAQPQPPSAAPGPTTYWYYCTDPAGYYPYVQNCTKAWMQVVPQAVPVPK